ncbi:DUF6233 domain-containing protein [Streptomyces sp. TRM 70351]|uniref:DUF6233 domain-containing protein n=1 Tax=Streptomyces sp. TRM 70351 TaxID=3116552 RepID=UPI002E7B28DE|nr:DUF6233 domain-containing protein [Streptomyces sp. TRM 70351]MEE1930840.1 DUF6233 domain-containing protein [Streptomyces sp. TRM 70351]
MTDEPSRLQLLHFTRRVVVQQATAALAQVDGWIAAEERREAERRRGQQNRPTPPDWLVQYGRDRTSVEAVHTGDCWAVAKSKRRCRPATRQQAADALRQQAPPCPCCRPDTALGILD